MIILNPINHTCFVCLLLLAKKKPPKKDLKKLLKSTE